MFPINLSQILSFLSARGKISSGMGLRLINFSPFFFSYLVFGSGCRGFLNLFCASLAWGVVDDREFCYL